MDEPMSICSIHPWRPRNARCGPRADNLGDVTHRQTERDKGTVRAMLFY